jgi:hypothetical protein
MKLFFDSFSPSISINHINQQTILLNKAFFHHQAYDLPGFLFLADDSHLPEYAIPNVRNFPSTCSHSNFIIITIIIMRPSGAIE